jgi:hypothetical protein
MWSGWKTGWLALFLFLGGCQSAGPLPETHRPTLVELRGGLQLVDGTPVTGAELKVTCGNTRLTVRTDGRGHFGLHHVPEGDCRVVCEQARLDQPLRVSRNLIGRTAGLDVVVTVPPMHRVSVRAHQVTWQYDETLTAWGIPVDVDARVVQRVPRAWMPLAFRGQPHGGEIKTVPLLDPQHRLTALRLDAPRTLVHLATCDEQATKRRVERLTQIADARAATGLRAVSIQTDPCRRRTIPTGVLAGGPEVLWALQARPGAMVVLDRSGNVLHQSKSLDAVVAHLEQSWPLFAAVRQVSVQSSVSVRDAQAHRLCSQASVETRARRYAEAHGLLDQAIQLDPQLAEARRERAILKARLGDISGAMREVTWWRSSFGEESAEDLLDEIQRVTASR